jgi:hypothetical protein
MTTTNTTTANTNNTIYVRLFSHSEYTAFDIFGGIFKSMEEAIEDYVKRNSNSKYPIIETLMKEEYDDLFVLPLFNKENIDEIKEDFEYSAYDTAYRYGGYVIRKMTI